MARESEPTLMPTDELTPAGIQRVNAFLRVLQERPSAMADILFAGQRPTDIITQARETPGTARSYVARAIRAAASVFEHGDDEETVPDRVTLRVIHSALDKAYREESGHDPRVTRLVTFATEVADYQQHLAAQPPGLPPPDTSAQLAPVFLPPAGV